jgi:glycosyltransferase involved in cell wall biosynthesis
LRVLHVITGLDVGGAEDQVVQLARESRNTVEVACMSAPGRAAERLTSLGIRVFAIPGSHQYDGPALTRLLRLMRSRRYDVVHTHLLRAGVYGQTAARLARVPAVLYTEHTLGREHVEDLPASPQLRAFYRLNGHLADVVVAVSPWVADRVREWGVSADKTRCIPNGLELGRWRYDRTAREAVRRDLGIPLGDPVIGIVGRMVPRKQHLLLLRAAARLIREGAWLVVVGDGPTRADVEREARELGIGSRTILTGTRHDIPAMLSGMDVFASLAAEEMFGLAPLEALTSGLPVLVTHCPSLASISDTRISWVSHDVVAIERELRHALEREPERRSVPSVVARYDVRRTAASVDDLHASLIGRRRMRRDLPPLRGS